MNEAAEAAVSWGATVTRPLRLRENEVYEVSIAGRRAALRLHRPGYQSEASIRSELWWCEKLGEAGLPIAAACLTVDGKLTAQLSSGRIASVVQWVDGVPLGEAGVPLPGNLAENRENHFRLGQLIARVHQATDALTLPDWFIRPHWDRNGFVGDAPLWGPFWAHPLLSDEDRAVLATARSWLNEKLLSTKSSFGLVHADVLRENVFVNEGSISLIDFDDSGFGYRWYDLGTVLSQDQYEPDLAGLSAALVAGYGSLLPVDPAEVDVFTLARCLASVGWAATRLSLDSPIQRSHIARAVRLSCRLVN